jgi:hypothetical protein
VTGPSSTPRGEHAGRPGARWQTQLVSTGEQLIDDDTPTPRPNRATRRAAKHAGRPPAIEEQPAMTSPARPTTFGLIRDHDVSGVSGTGRVADGVLWPDGTVSVRWRGDRPSIVHWGGLADVEHVHGHGGHTRIVWDDEGRPTMWAYEAASQAVERHRARADQAEARIAAVHQLHAEAPPDAKGPTWEALDEALGAREGAPGDH